MAAVRALQSARGEAKNDAADLSFSLREAVEHSAQAVSEAARYGVDADAGLLETAQALGESAKALAAAAASTGRIRSQALVEAKRWAMEAERLRRLIRADAHEDPSLARGLKREAVCKRLSSAAAAIHDACDALVAGVDQ